MTTKLAGKTDLRRSLEHYIYMPHALPDAQTNSVKVVKEKVFKDVW